MRDTDSLAAQFAAKYLKEKGLEEDSDQVKRYYIIQAAEEGFLAGYKAKEKEDERRDEP